MHPIVDLRRFLKTDTQQQGILLSIEANTLTVSTNTGIKTFTRSNQDATAYKVGDTIMVSNGVVSGRRSNTSSTIYVL